MTAPTTVRTWPQRRTWWLTLARDLAVGMALGSLLTAALIACWLLGQARAA